jgi:pimeloyl-ACP methyl ester carboxylesterase
LFKKWWARVLAAVVAVLLIAGIAAYSLLIAPFTFYQTRNPEVAAGTAEYVLVPGAGHPAASYDRVKTILEEHGQTVHALTLPGVGERRNELTPQTGLETHIDDVVAFLNDHDLHNVILVGHSYAGMVITGVADRVPARIGHIVYLDAVHPKNGQNLVEAQPLVKNVPAVSQPHVVDGVEVNLLPDKETIDFLGLSKTNDVAWAKDHLTPHPWKAFTDHLDLTHQDAVAAIDKTDIYTNMTAWGLSLFGLLTDSEKSHAWVIYSGHDLMLTEPELTADMLLEVAVKQG